MNRSKIFRAAGVLSLLAVGAVAGRASTKASVTKLYYSAGPGVCHELASAVTPIGTLLTTGASTNQAAILTAGISQTAHKLYSTSTCKSASAVHFNG